MAMTKEQKEWLEFGGIVVGGILLYLLLSRGNMAQSLEEPPSLPQVPNYLNYNNPNYNASPLSSLPSLPTQPNGSEGGGPACASCSASSITFNGLSGFEQQLQQLLGSQIDTYEEAVQSTFPPSIAQFFNNNSGYDEEETAQGQFSSMTYGG